MEVDEEVQVMKQVNSSLLEELEMKEREVELLKKQLEEFVSNGLPSL